MHNRRLAGVAGRQLLLLVAVTARGAAAQEGPPPPDPLAAVVVEALANNASLAEQRLLEERAAAEAAEARGRYLPAVGIDSRYTRQSGTVDLGEFVNPAYGALNQITGTQRFPTDLSVTLPLTHDSRIRLTQTLFSERVRAGVSAAGHEYRSVHEQRLARARSVAAEAQTTFLQVAAARSARRVWEETLPLVEESERVAERLVSAGSATPDAVFRARAERSEVVQRLDEAEERERAAVRALNQLLGRSLDTPVDSVDERLLLRPIPVSEEEAVHRALAGREELDALDQGVASLDAGVRAATAGYLPEVAVALDYGFQGRDVSFGADSDYWTASLVLSWNVFNGGQTGARRHAAIAERDRIRVHRDDTENLIRLEARQAYHSAVVARDAIRTAEDQLAAAERSFTLVRRRYEEGLASTVEFLDARTALTSAELNRVITVYRYAMRWVELERAAALRNDTAMGGES